MASARTTQPRATQAAARAPSPCTARQPECLAFPLSRGRAQLCRYLLNRLQAQVKQQLPSTGMHGALTCLRRDTRRCATLYTCLLRQAAPQRALPDAQAARLLSGHTLTKRRKFPQQPAPNKGPAARCSLPNLQRVSSRAFHRCSPPTKLRKQITPTPTACGDRTQAPHMAAQSTS